MMFRGFGLGGIGPGGGIPVIFMFIFCVIVVGLIVFAITRVGRHGYGCCQPSTHDAHDALDIAKERYAKGEIDEKEFNQIKKNLS